MTARHANGPLTDETLAIGIRTLARKDAALAGIVSRLGPPPMWAREPGFATLVHIVLEQQVSLASARAAFLKLGAAAGRLTPTRFLEFNDQELRQVGFSRQKAGYCRGIANAILAGDLRMDAIDAMSDEEARGHLIRIRGIGPWTADIYLLMVLRRPDIFPSGDLALASAVQQVMGLPYRPSHDELMGIAATWKPWRAVAARLLWHHYLS